MKDIGALILAAGKGTRMKSKLPKVLHKVAGKAMVERVLDTVQSLGTEKNIIVIGFGGDMVKDYIGDRADFVVQEEQKGTGHAVKQAQPMLETFDGTILVLCGDTPLVKRETLQALLETHEAMHAAATVLTAHMPDPTGYGRIIRDDQGHVLRIVEQKDGKPEELAVTEVNTGMYAFDSHTLWPCLAQLSDDNAQGELYITDVISILVNAGECVSAYVTDDFEESLGVNSRAQLAEAEAILKHRKNRELMESGVTIIDPLNTYVAPEVTVGQDTILYPGTILEGHTIIGRECQIGPHTRLTNVTVGDGNTIHFTYGHDCEIKNNTDIGPYVHVRPNTVIYDTVHIGNFVEVKNSHVGEGTKLPHLSYIGDSDIGSGVNIGCGSITVNYDGKIKHRTTIGNGAFVGCNSNLVAPVTVGEYSYIGAGSTITKDVPSKALAVGRSKQIIKEHWVTEDTFKKQSK
ncbi:bifunctional UDP-N-acetylglucosamine diphosphorylase/glucosamine-1-phosphate N-acetyltransferase GlmU [Veillonella montpellierensis]|uniref:bifunctional UDP-N-acetylglucosamine diphosphorylase/glucosamine-1-phosphate N-acetyltransferase GlmU n=1 Tax=Veillonella montpellierensis TaxID=187328 RepID=UPI0023F9ED13|nr:bifunctional UDP-N-acetylglucosamine diphosphorylase/glucosamine-1-phosphate N-acetyltransferase GlmU [Veillonella montpellierensis]